jgi:hypothetical protein
MALTVNSKLHNAKYKNMVDRFPLADIADAKSKFAMYRV